ncbi:unnamed protein product [Ceutorhynchus assimilis]|uniref:Myb/SANT-like DNA-binding domain-containing protein n=1 Tax=Ceutorhynchus assimilis TaxID=467358 RepID=A0A9N9QDD2_9CUCU|nr:unnamed protein product [Ceutorhynchus assimilis]
MGTLKEVIDKDLAHGHVCLLKAQDVVIDFEKKTVSAQKKKMDTCQPQPVAGCSYKTYESSLSAAHISQDSGEEPLCLDDSISDMNNFNTEICGTEKQISKTQANHDEVQALVQPLLSNITREIQWSDGSIMLLIAAYKDSREKFSSPLYNKKKVWELISQSLAKQGVFKSATECDEKWRNLKKHYDKILTERNMTGNSAIFWRFFEDFQEIYFRDPRFQPVATCSSSGGYKRRADSENSDENSACGSKSLFEKKKG